MPEKRYKRREFLKGLSFLGVGALAGSLASRIAQAYSIPQVEKIYSPKHPDFTADVLVYRDGEYAVAVDNKGNTIARSTDHAEAIQKAIDHVQNQGGGKISLGSGTFYLSKPIEVTKLPLFIEGAGNGTTLIYPSRSLNDYMIKVGKTDEHQNYFGLKNVSIWGGRSVGYTNKGILLRRLSFVYMENVRILGFIGTALRMEEVWDSGFIRVTVDSSGNPGTSEPMVHIHHGGYGDNSNNLFFFGFHVESNYYDAIVIEGDPTQETTMNRMIVFVGLKTHPLLPTPSGYPQVKVLGSFFIFFTNSALAAKGSNAIVIDNNSFHIYIKGNRFGGSGDYPIKISNASKILIQGNGFYETNGAVYADSTTSGIHVVDNIIDNSGTPTNNAIELFFDNRIIGNKIHGKFPIAIYVTGAQNEIIGNRIYTSSSGEGINANTTANTISDNYIQYCTRGILVNTDSIVKGNRVFECDRGIEIGANAKRVNIIGNDIRDGRSTPEMDYGILENNGCDYNIIALNNIRGYTTEAIHTVGTNDVVVNNIT